MISTRGRLACTQARHCPSACGWAYSLRICAARAVRQQAMLHRQHDLRDNLQVAVHEHVQRVRDHALGGVLHRHHAVIRAVLAHLAEDIGDGLHRRVVQAGPETANGGLVGEGRLRPQIRHRQGLLEHQGAGHDLPVNRPQRLIGERPQVSPADPLQHRSFAMGRVNLLVGLALHLADGQHVFGPLVQQLDDLRVELVNGLAMFGDIHSQNACGTGLAFLAFGLRLWLGA